MNSSPTVPSSSNACDPVSACDIDGAAVRPHRNHPRIEIQACRSGHSALRIMLADPDRLLVCVRLGKPHPAAVRRECQTVGDPESIIPSSDIVVMIKPFEAPCTLARMSILHRFSPKAVACVGCPVVEPVFVQMG